MQEKRRKISKINRLRFSEIRKSDKKVRFVVETQKTRSWMLRVWETPGALPVQSQGEDFPGQDYCQRVSLSQSLGKPIALISASGNSTKSAFSRSGKVVLLVYVLFADYHRLS